VRPVVGCWVRASGGDPLPGRELWLTPRPCCKRAGKEVGMEECAIVGTATAMMAAAWAWVCEMETVGGVPEVDPIPEALMAAAAAAAEAAGKLPRAAGTRGVRNTPGF